jgi:hypothetical protein
LEQVVPVERKVKLSAVGLIAGEQTASDDELDAVLDIELFEDTLEELEELEELADDNIELRLLDETIELDEKLFWMDELAIDELIDELTDDVIEDEFIELVATEDTEATEESWLADCDDIDDRLDCTILDEFVWSLPPPQADSAIPIIKTNPNRFKKC